MSEDKKDTIIDLGGGQTYGSPAASDEQGARQRFDQAVSNEDIVKAALGAIYNCETRFASEMLLEAFDRIEGPHRGNLGSITETFLQMHKTTYRVDEFIREMKKKGPEPTDMVDHIEAAEEFKIMFAAE